MKYLFFLLVLANIVLYLWETGIDQEPAPPKQEILDGERIMLRKEVSEPIKPIESIEPSAPTEPAPTNPNP
jgi:hypothetical protein